MHNLFAGETKIGAKTLKTKIKIPHPSLSDCHCAITIKNEKEFYIEDLDSLKGTFIINKDGTAKRLENRK